MTRTAARKISTSAPAPEHRPLGSRFRAFCADFWLNYFFWHARHLPWVARKTKWFYLWFALRYSHVIQRSTWANAGRILGPGTPPASRRRFARNVVGNFYDFVYDIGRAQRMPTGQMAQLIDSVQGEDRYLQARAAAKGAIVVTAHMGSFEAGIAALLRHERDIHILFKRDERNRFEQIRQSLRHRLGVHEAAIDDGWSIWLRLRDALAANQVLIMQGDRVMPGQKGQVIPFLHGHLLLPTGPIKLAAATGSPIIPIFSLRTPGARIRICIEDPIWIDPAAESIDDIHPALLQFARVLEKYVCQYPEQWLLLQPAFCEDADCLTREIIP